MVPHSKVKVATSILEIFHAVAYNDSGHRYTDSDTAIGLYFRDLGSNVVGGRMSDALLWETP